MKYLLTSLLILMIIVSGILYTSEQNAIKEIPLSSIVHKPVDDYTYNVIKEITSASYMGRLPGTAGNLKTVKFLVEQFKSLGLTPPTKYPDYLQSFQQDLMVVNSPAVLITSRKTGEVTGEYNNLSDYNGLALWPHTMIKGEVKAELVNVTSMEQLSRANKKIKNKVLLIDKRLAYALQYDARQAEGIVNKVKSLSGYIKAAIINFDNKRDGYFHVSKQMRRLNRGGKKLNNKNGPILMYCSNDAYPYLQEAAERGDSAYLKVDFSLEKCNSSNVIGIIEGTNQKSKKHLIVGAHLDHIGDNKDETYNPGALDNASGIAGILEIARTLLAKDERPEYDIIFIAFNGEEEYFAGSNHYVSNPLVSLDYTTMLNFDMIGAKGAEYLEICYAGTNSIKLSEQIVNYTKNIGIASRSSYILSSDHVTFTVCGVPSVMFKQLQEIQRHHTMQDSYELTIDINKHQEAVNAAVKFITEEYYK